MMSADVPHSGDQRRDQSTGKDAARLQRIDGENLRRMVGVLAPIVDDVENLRTHNAAQYDEDAEVPRLVGIDALLGRVAYADPESKEDAVGDQKAIRWQKEAAEMKKLGVHDYWMRKIL